MEPDKDSSPADQPDNLSGAPEQDVPATTTPSEPSLDNDLLTATEVSDETPSDAAPVGSEATTNSSISDIKPVQATPTAPAEPAVSDGPSASSEESEKPQVFMGAADPSSSTGVSSPEGISSGKPKGKRLKWAIVAVVVLVLVLGGGYTFAFYLPNTPSNVYKSGLTNTGKAADKLVDYMQQEQGKSYKSVSFDGKADVKSGSGSGDATLSGAFDKSGNGTLNANIDIAGEHVQLNGRSVVAKGNTTPDLYLQVTGVKTLLDNVGMSSLDSLDGKWISVDHTLVDTYKKDFTQGFASGLGNSDTQLPTLNQVTGTIADVQTVNKQYIFTTDSQKAVLTNQKFLGKETKDGRTLNHYTVGYNKAHLQAYVAALKTTLDASPLNDWSKKANDGKSLSESMNWSDLEKSVSNAKNNYTFDVWVDTKTKLINSVQFTDLSDSSTKFTIGQNYTGGTSYPLSLGFSDKDSSGNPETGILGLTVDTSTHKYTGAFSVSTKGNDAADVSATFTLTPGTTPVQVTAPENAESINDVLSQLGLLGAGTASGANGLSSDSSALLL